MSDARSPMPPSLLGYGRQDIAQADVDAVIAALRSDRLTQGPAVRDFERALSEFTGAREAVVCNNGTSALYALYRSLGIGPGSTVLTTPITFAATAGVAKLLGAQVVMADVDARTGCLDPDVTDRLLATRGRGAVDLIAAMHHGGHPADMPALSEVASRHGARLVEDACHALGGQFAGGDPIGSSRYSAACTFSFHPVKAITTGEGGAVTTDDNQLAEAIRKTVNHSITRAAAFVCERQAVTDGIANPWYYEVSEPGLNLRMSDIQAALGVSQLARLPQMLAARERVADEYDDLLSDAPEAPLRKLPPPGEGRHGRHLYMVRIDYERCGTTRAKVMNAMHERGIGTQVHYIPLYRQPLFAADCGPPDLYPNAEAFYREVLTLPCHPGMQVGDAGRVVEALGDVLGGLE